MSIGDEARMATRRLTTPKDGERMACEVATKKQGEEMSTVVVCRLIEAHFQIPEAICERLLEKAWDAVAARCPAGPLLALSRIHISAPTRLLSTA